MLLHEIIKQKGWQLILASQSPRRRELMASCELPFEVQSFDVEEVYPAELPAAEVPEYLAKLKGDGYPTPLTEKQIVISADTIVHKDNQIIGKPKSREDAVQMLQNLSGSYHTVITGVALRSATRNTSFSVHTRVHFAELSQEQIEYYIDHYKPMDKAGSYGIQEWIGYIAVDSIEGSFHNVMGLPIQRLYQELTKMITE